MNILLVLSCYMVVVGLTAALPHAQPDDGDLCQF